MILACDQCDDTIWLMWGDKTKVEQREVKNQEDAVRQIQELGEKAEQIVFSDSVRIEISEPLVKKQKVVPRLQAAFWELRERISSSDCLIISIGQNRCVAGKITNGQLVSSSEDRSLGLKTLYKEWMENVPSILTSYPKESGADPFLWGFHDLLARLRRDKSFAFSDLNNLEKQNVSIWKERLLSFLTQVDAPTSPQNEKKPLLCTDWAGAEPVKMFFTQYETSCSPNPSTDVLYGLFRQTESSPPVKKKRSRQKATQPLHDRSWQQFIKRVINTSDIDTINYLKGDKDLQTWSKADVHVAHYFSLLFAHKYIKFHDVKLAVESLESILPSSCKCEDHCAGIIHRQELILASLDLDEKEKLKQKIGIVNSSTPFEHLKERRLIKAYHSVMSRLEIKLWRR